ncbi:MAG: MBOAT family protein [Lachnospiraceae bacterium]|jgi:alginate O-acetyltransferase complex protein AlgI|nr:MBOAT family protein [Lachnospiraceae bacterium]
MVSNIMLTLLFLGAVLVAYYLSPPRGRWGVLLTASLIFYLSANPWMVLMVGASACWSWFAGRKIEAVETPGTKRGWLLGGVLPLLGILFLFKYFNFFTVSVAELLNLAGLGASPVTLKLILPLGISYYTFRIISYVADIYTGKRKSEEHLGYYLTYVLFFPQILSGPIERSESFLNQLHGNLIYDSSLFSEGFQRIILGLFKKMVIANRLTGYVDLIFADPENYPGLAVWLAAFFYSFQIYCDFSGYSDIAIGMGNLFGIRSKRNFHYPYFAKNIRDFWDRWHISLSSWLRDYIYIPLGGNRVSRIRKYGNVLATFLVSGLWHGDNWTFVVWGGIHGIWNICSRRQKGEQGGFLRICWRTLVTFVGVTLAWIFFRADSLGKAFTCLRHGILNFSLSFSEIQGTILPFTGDNTCAAYFLTVCAFLLLLFLYEWGQAYGGGKGNSGEGEYGKGFCLSAFWLAVMIGSIVLFGVFGVSGFLYAQF